MNHVTTSSARTGVCSPLPAELQPLEIHPSVHPELARGLLAAVEHIANHPDEFDMGRGYNDGVGTAGCLMCHAERLSSFRRLVTEVGDFRAGPHALIPLGNWARIYRPDMWFGVRYNYNDDNGLMARVSHFLATGE